MRRRLYALVVLAAVAAIAAAMPASGAPHAKTYARVLASGTFIYALDYGSHPDSALNGKYVYNLSWKVDALVAYDGRNVSSVTGAMLADGGVTIDSRMTQWNGSGSRVPVHCSAPGSVGGQGQRYRTDTDGGRLSGGGGVAISSGGLTVNPGRAIKWSVGCSATESLTTHGLPGGPAFHLPAPRRAALNGSRTFTTGCSESYRHDWDPGRDVPGAHTFQGAVRFVFSYTRFKASELKTARALLRDRVGDEMLVPSGKLSKSCP